MHQTCGTVRLVVYFTLNDFRAAEATHGAWLQHWKQVARLRSVGAH